MYIYGFVGCSKKKYGSAQRKSDKRLVEVHHELINKQNTSCVKPLAQSFGLFLWKSKVPVVVEEVGDFRAGIEIWLVLVRLGNHNHKGFHGRLAGATYTIRISGA